MDLRSAHLGGPDKAGDQDMAGQLRVQGCGEMETLVHKQCVHALGEPGQGQ